MKAVVSQRQHTKFVAGPLPVVIVRVDFLITGAISIDAYRISGVVTAIVGGKGQVLAIGVVSRLIIHIAIHESTRVHHVVIGGLAFDRQRVLDKFLIPGIRAITLDITFTDLRRGVFPYTVCFRILVEHARSTGPVISEVDAQGCTQAGFSELINVVFDESVIGFCGCPRSLP